MAAATSSLRALDLSPFTIKRYVANTFDKLAVVLANPEVASRAGRCARNCQRIGHRDWWLMCDFLLAYTTPGDRPTGGTLRRNAPPRERGYRLGRARSLRSNANGAPACPLAGAAEWRTGLHTQGADRHGDASSRCQPDPVARRLNARRVPDVRAAGYGLERAGLPSSLRRTRRADPWRVTCLVRLWQSISIRNIVSHARQNELVVRCWQSIATPTAPQRVRVRGVFVRR